MKKRLASILLVATCLAFAACGKDGGSVESSQKQTESGTKESKTKESSSDNTEVSNSSDELPKEYSKVSQLKLFSLYMNYHVKHREQQFAHGNYYEDSVCIPVLVRYDEEIFGKKFDGGLKDIFDLYNNGDAFRAASRCSTRGSFEMEEDIIIELDSSEEKKVNDFDTIHFTGHASYNDENSGLIKFYVTGYTFMFEDEPYMLVGIVYGEKDGEDLRTSMDEEIDYMMTTVRTEQ